MQVEVPWPVVSHLLTERLRLWYGSRAILVSFPVLADSLHVVTLGSGPQVCLVFRYVCREILDVTLLHCIVAIFLALQTLAVSFTLKNVPGKVERKDTNQSNVTIKTANLTCNFFSDDVTEILLRTLTLWADCTYVFAVSNLPTVTDLPNTQYVHSL